MTGLRYRINRRMAAMTLAASLAAFGSSGAQAQETLRMSTLGIGTSAYVVLNTFANIINDKMGNVSIRVNSTGAATQHMVQAAEGRVAFFTMSPAMFNAMSNKSAMFADVANAAELAQELSVLFNFPAGVYHLVTYGDSGIERLEDLAGKSVFLGPPGGAATQVMMDLGEGATGLVPNTDFNVVQLGWNAGHQAFQDRQLDAAMFLGNLPASAVAQIALTSDIRLLGLEQRHFDQGNEKLKALLARPGGLTVDIPSGTYGDGQVNTGPTTSVAVYVGLAAGRDLDEEMVYQMTKTWWENIDEARKVAPWMSTITLEDALTELNAPLHPGAARYYREIGLDLSKVTVR